MRYERRKIEKNSALLDLEQCIAMLQSTPNPIAYRDAFCILRVMTKSDIIDRVADGTGLTKLETEAVIDGFLKTVAEALCHEEHVEIRGFGTFRIKERAPRIGRNPRTGEVVDLDGQFVPHFKVSRELRDLVDRAIKSSAKEQKNDE